jgi:hypothetical protein
MVNFWMTEPSWTIGLNNLCMPYCTCRHVREGENRDAAQYNLGPLACHQCLVVLVGLIYLREKRLALIVS